MSLSTSSSTYAKDTLLHDISRQWPQAFTQCRPCFLQEQFNLPQEFLDELLQLHLTTFKL